MKFNLKGGPATVVVNGRSYHGANVSIRNGKVTVDGVVQDDELVGEVHVTVNGDIEKLEVGAGAVTAHNVGSVTSQSGDVSCGDVSGSVSSMSGDVTCGAVGGSVSSMSGDIRNTASAKRGAPLVDPAPAAPDWLAKETYAVQHNPNCPRPYLVRLVRAGRIGLDMLQYAYTEDPGGLTADALGFGVTLTEAAENARMARDGQQQSKQE